MSPWLAIWTSPRKTIDQLKDSNWVNGPGLLVYIVLGINSVSEEDVPAFILNIENVFLQNLSLICLGIVWGLVCRLIWVNLTFFVGKSLEGQATKRNVDTVLTLSLTPEFIKFMYLIMACLFSGQSLIDFEPSIMVYIVCAIATFFIAIVGLHRVQRFGYKYVLLNILMPFVALTAALFFMIS